jgi:hypothetical protein
VLRELHGERGTGKVVTTTPPSGSFQVYRVLEEEELQDEQGWPYRTITKQVFLGNIDNPTNANFVTWMELEELYGPGYYLVEIPERIRRRYVVPDGQRGKTAEYYEPSPYVSRQGNKIIYSHSLPFDR